MRRRWTPSLLREIVEAGPAHAIARDAGRHRVGAFPPGAHGAVSRDLG